MLRAGGINFAEAKRILNIQHMQTGDSGDGDAKIIFGDNIILIMKGENKEKRTGHKKEMTLIISQIFE